jgi:predicted PurR-regulated permease PerM
MIMTIIEVVARFVIVITTIYVILAYFKFNLFWIVIISAFMIAWVYLPLLKYYEKPKKKTISKTTLKSS